MRTVIIFIACFGTTFIAQAAADDPMAVLRGKQEEYPGDPALCEQLIRQVDEGASINAIQEEQLKQLNHPQLGRLAWHVGVYQKACAMMVMSRNRPDLWDQIERVCAELKTAPSKTVRNPREYQSPEQATYNYIFECKSQLNTTEALINQELAELGEPAEPEPWQLLDYELFVAYQEKKKTAHITDRTGNEKLSHQLMQRVNDAAGEAIKKEQLEDLNRAQLQELQKHIGVCREAYDFVQEHCCRQRKFWQHVNRITAEMDSLKAQLLQRAEKDSEYPVRFSAIKHLAREQESVQALDERIRNQLNSWDVKIDTDVQGLLDVHITKRVPKSL
jgi:hypothetical protein